MREPVRGGVELVVASSENDVIGRANGLPWRLKDDLKHFKALTLGKPILMGRKTFDSIGRPLPGRTNIVLTRSAEFAPPGVTVVADMPAALAAAAAAAPPAPLMVIGGAQVYELCLPWASRIHLTLVHARISDGDTRFAGWRGGEWIETARVLHAAGEDNDFDYSFITLDRAA